MPCGDRSRVDLSCLKRCEAIGTGFSQPTSAERSVTILFVPVQLPKRLNEVPIGTHLLHWVMWLYIFHYTSDGPTVTAFQSRIGTRTSTARLPRYWLITIDFGQSTRRHHVYSHYSGSPTRLMVCHPLTDKLKKVLRLGSCVAYVYVRSRSSGDVAPFKPSVRGAKTPVTPQVLGPSCFYSTIRRKTRYLDFVGLGSEFTSLMRNTGWTGTSADQAEVSDLSVIPQRQAV